MWQKRQRNKDEQAPPGKRLKENILELYGSGSVPADRTQDLLEDAGAFAHSLGSDEFQDMRRRVDLREVLEIFLEIFEGSSSRPLTGHPCILALWELGQSNSRSWRSRRWPCSCPMRFCRCWATWGLLRSSLTLLALDVHNQKRHGKILESMGCPFVSVSLWGDGVSLQLGQASQLWHLVHLSSWIGT